MLNGIVLSVVMLNVVKLSVAMVSVVGPEETLENRLKNE